MLIQKRKNCYI